MARLSFKWVATFEGAAMADRPQQRAGDGSNQMQVMGNLHVGVSAQEALDIARYVARDVAQKFTSEALEEANRRIEDFDCRLVAVMTDDHKLDAFREPAFQILTKKAQRAAAASGRETDYDRLSHLLASRAHEPDRTSRAATDLAVQAVDLVDDQALAGLTSARLFQLAWVLDGQIGPGLNQYERWARALVELPLPEGDEWIEHLDSLGLVRISRSEVFNSSSQVLQSYLSGYTCRGVDSESEDFAVLQSELQSAGIRHSLLAHELSPGKMRFAISGDHAIEHFASLPSPTIPNEIQFKSLAERFTGYGTPDPEVMGRMTKEIEDRPTLAEMCRWWDTPTVAFRFTLPGLTLATANSTRLRLAAGLGPS